MSLLAAWFWPKVSDRKNAQFAITEASGVAAALAVITAILATLEVLRPTTDTAEGLGAEAFLSPVLFAGIAFGIYRKSRLAAISGLVLYLAGRAYALVKAGPNIGFIPMLVALALLHGVRGTFAYHKLPSRPAGLPSLAKSFEALSQNPPASGKNVGNTEEGPSL